MARPGKPEGPESADSDLLMITQTGDTAVTVMMAPATDRARPVPPGPVCGHGH